MASEDEANTIKDSLNSVQKWMKQIRKNFASDMEQKTMSSESFTALLEISKLFGKENEKNRKLGDQLTKDNAGQILTQYYKFMTSGGRNTPMERDDAECLEKLRFVCVYSSDASRHFCLELGRSGLISYLVEELRALHARRDDKNVIWIICRCLDILHNCSKKRKNRKYFKRENATATILQYKDIQCTEAQVTAMLTLAYLNEGKNAGLIAANKDIIESILKYLKRAIECDDHCADGFSAKELVDGLCNLAYNEENGIKIVNENVLPILVELLEKGTSSEKASSAKMVWRLSFRDENKPKIQQQENMMIILKALAKNTGFQEGQQAQSAAIGALWELRETEDGQVAENAEVTSSAQPTYQYDIMISYQWDYQNIAIQLKKNLEEQNYVVWMDLEKMKGDMLETTAKAIKNSKVFLFCVSETYERSNWCRIEARYAFVLHKHCIPILVKQGYMPDEGTWLDILTRTRLYYDFSDNDLFTLHFPKLVDELGGHCTSADVVNGLSKLIKKWDKDDVDKWAINNQITSIKDKNLDGKTLVFLHSIRKKAPEFFFKLLAEKLGITELKELAAFCSGLEALTV